MLPAAVEVNFFLGIFMIMVIVQEVVHEDNMSNRIYPLEIDERTNHLRIQDTQQGNTCVSGHYICWSISAIPGIMCETTSYLATVIYCWPCLGR